MNVIIIWNNTILAVIEHMPWMANVWKIHTKLICSRSCLYAIPQLLPASTIRRFKCGSSTAPAAPYRSNHVERLTITANKQQRYGIDLLHGEMKRKQSDNKRISAKTNNRPSHDKDKKNSQITPTFPPFIPVLPTSWTTICLPSACTMHALK